MRIIAGRFKSLKLYSFSSPPIRPMTDRVKTSVFDTLKAFTDWQGVKVLDLFSGSGALALEALSRGAGEALCVDFNSQALKLIRKNRNLLCPRLKCRSLKQNVFHFLLTPQKEPYDVVFADPPFAKKWTGKILQHLLASPSIKKGSLLVMEASCHEADPTNSKKTDTGKVQKPPWPLQKTLQAKLITKKEFGDKKVLFYRFY